MAQWTNIPTDRIEPGKHIRAIDGLALRDNPIAIAEGAAGAPKISEQAFSTNSINGNRLRTNSIPNDRLTNNSITGAKFNDGSIRSWLGSQSAGAVGTYAFARYAAGSNNSRLPWSHTTSGSNLRVNTSTGTSSNEISLSGTWRHLGYGGVYGGGSSVPLEFGLFLRIS